MDKYREYFRIALIFVLVYFFLLSIQLIGKGAGFLGEDFARKLICTTSDPFVGLFIGILVTALVQSSSLTTSLVVALVGGGVLSLPNAIPIIMGANIGTTVTNTLVALGHISWRQEFRRAFAAGTMHDFFNILTVIMLFPLELKFRYLTRLALFLERFFEDIGGIKFTSPLKLVLSPIVKALEHLFFQTLSLAPKAGGLLMIISGCLFLFASLIFLVRLLRKLFIGKAEILLDRYIFRNDLFAMGIGFFITVLAQSSSLTISVMVPLAGAGVLSLSRIFPYTMGANVGTTFTALLASLAIVGEGRSAALAAALAHFCFNLTGIVIFYPIKSIRNIPINLSRRLAHICAKRRYFAFIYVFTVFILLPLTVIFLKRCFK
ncbi:MAG: Na/Pi symporter [Candidatus Omnitrophica bacterium]|nr:Na/Pi symporter [Candidatus Omnitrophota bacterium]